MPPMTAKHVVAVLALQAPFVIAAAVPVGGDVGVPQPPLAAVPLSTRDARTGLLSSVLAKLGLLGSRDSGLVEYSSYGDYGQYGQYGSYGSYPDAPAGGDTEPNAPLPYETPPPAAPAPEPAPDGTYGEPEPEDTRSSYPPSDSDDFPTPTESYYPSTTSAAAVAAVTTNTYLSSIGAPIWSYAPSATSAPYYTAGDDEDTTTYITQPLMTITVPLSLLRPTSGLETSSLSYI